MANLKVFLKLFWKSKRIILLYMIIFTFLAISFTATAKDENFINVRLLIIDREKTEKSDVLLESLRDHFQVTVKDHADVTEELYLNRYDAALKIQPGFFEDSKKLEIITGNETIRELITTRLDAFYTYADAMADKGSLQILKETVRQKVGVSFLKKDQAGIEQGMAAYFSVCGYILLAIILMVTGEVIRSLMTDNIFLRREIAKDSYVKQNMEIIFGEILSGIFIWAFVTLIGYILMKNGGRNFVFYALNALVVLFWAIPLANMLANIAKDKNIISMLANTVSLGLAFVSGVFVPMEMMGRTAVKIAKFTPLYYHVIAMRHVFEGNTTYKELLIQLLFGFLFFEITVIYQKYIYRKKS